MLVPPQTRGAERPRRPRPSAFIANDVGYDLAIFLVATLYVLVAPYTKVEESFNMQAVHDVLDFGVRDTSRFDHHDFPGVVPRTFISPLLLASLVYPLHAVISLVPSLNRPPPAPPLAQILTRLVLAAVTSASLAVLRRAVAARYTRHTGQFFVLVTLAQFHILFYASRTLPNTFALSLANVSLAQALHPRSTFYRAVATLSISTALLRSELSILLAATILSQPLTSPVPLGRFFIRRTVQYGLASAVATALVSIAIDSHFWARLCYPEWEVFYFNAIRNKSSAWGTLPFHWYLTSALPRALTGALPLAAVGAYAHPADVAPALLPAVLFVLVYSLLPHKELRFIIYALPPFNIAAAVGLERLYRSALRLYRKRQRLRVVFVIFLAAAASLTVSVLATAVSLAASVRNYPGGRALSALQARELRTACSERNTQDWQLEKFTVHIDTAAAMAGVTRFLERLDGGAGAARKVACTKRRWIYSRAEGADFAKIDANTVFSHMLSERPFVANFTVQAVESAFGGFKIHMWPPEMSMVTNPAVYTHVKRQNIVVGHKYTTMAATGE